MLWTISSVAWRAPRMQLSDCIVSASWVAGQCVAGERGPGVAVSRTTRSPGEAGNGVVCSMAKTKKAKASDEVATKKKKKLGEIVI